MNKLKTKLLSFSCLSILLLSTTLPAVAKPKPTTTTIYQRAKKELPTNLYGLYRIIDRVARANKMDNLPWRIVIVRKYNINAFATNVNLIAMYDGILDQLSGDSSALACVVAHEMGHHIKRHIAISQAKKKELVAKIREEAEREVLGEKRAANAEATATAVGSAVSRRVVKGPFGGLLSSVLGSQSRNRLSRGQKRINRIVKQKQQELEQRIAQESRNNELEADEVGYIASVKAGFEPEGCLRAMEVLARTPGAELDTTHPAVPKRIEALKKLIQKYPPQTLVKEGEALISKTKPLTYDISLDKTSLRINSVRGGSVADDIDKKFGL
ncbi:MAG: M48 family metallopeptidase [Calothrix sp. MO_192.B10]|nr:M48 family metallopeptidase [Calothrix sp. MO_192.B10]